MSGSFLLCLSPVCPVRSFFSFSCFILVLFFLGFFFCFSFSLFFWGGGEGHLTPDVFLEINDALHLDTCPYALFVFCCCGVLPPVLFLFFSVALLSGVGWLCVTQRLSCPVSCAGCVSPSRSLCLSRFRSVSVSLSHSLSLSPSVCLTLSF